MRRLMPRWPISAESAPPCSRHWLQFALAALVGRSARLHVGMLPGPLELPFHRRGLSVLVLRRQRQLQSIQRPAVVGIALEIGTVDRLRRDRLPDFQQLRTEQMARRKEPVSGLIVGQRILAVGGATQQRDGAFRAISSNGNARLGYQSGNAK